MFTIKSTDCVNSMSTRCCAGTSQDPLAYLNRLVRGGSNNNNNHNNNNPIRSESLCSGTGCSGSGSRAWIVLLLPCTGLRTRCLRFIRAVLTEVLLSFFYKRLDVSYLSVISLCVI